MQNFVRGRSQLFGAKNLMSQWYKIWCYGRGMTVLIKHSDAGQDKRKIGWRYLMTRATMLPDSDKSSRPNPSITSGPKEQTSAIRAKRELGPQVAALVTAAREDCFLKSHTANSFHCIDNIWERLTTDLLLWLLRVMAVVLDRRQQSLQIYMQRSVSAKINPAWLS